MRIHPKPAPRWLPILGGRFVVMRCRGRSEIVRRIVETIGIVSSVAVAPLAVWCLELRCVFGDTFGGGGVTIEGSAPLLRGQRRPRRWRAIAAAATRRKKT